MSPLPETPAIRAARRCASLDLFAAAGALATGFAHLAGVVLAMRELRGMMPFLRTTAPGSPFRSWHVEAVMAQLVIGAVATIAVLGAPALGWCGRRLRRRLEADPAGAPRWLLAGALAALVAGAMPVLAAAVLAGRLAGAGTSRRLRIFQNVGDILFFLIAVLPLAALLANAWTWVRHRRALRAHAQDPPEPATAPG